MGADSSKSPSSIIVGLLKQGSVDVKTAKETLTLKAGDFYINAATSEYQVDVGASKTLRIMLPLEFFPDVLGPRSGLEFVRGTNPVARILTTAVNELEQELFGGRSTHLNQISGITRDIVKSILMERNASKMDDGYRLMRIRARYFVEANIASPDLTIEMIAEHAHASRATLYRAFESAGGVREFVTQTRLDRACKLLESNPPHRGQIKDVAYSCGFTSVNAFCRVFNRRYGMTPGAWSRRSAGGIA